MTRASPTAPSTAEGALILACASVAPDRPRSSQAGGALDWARVMTLATRHGLRPLLHARLRADDGCPEPVRNDLARHYLANARHNLLLTGVLTDLLVHLAADGVEAVPFKGPVLAQDAYGSLSLREFADLDVVVRPADAERALTLLQAAGYTLQKGAAGHARTGYHRPLAHLDTGVEVELHWGVTQAYLNVDLDLEACWSRAHPRSVAGRSLPGFSLEDTLVLLCVHGGKHLWLGLGWIRDVAGLLAGHPDVAWDVVADTARRAGCERMVRLGLHLAHDLLDAPLPDGMAEDLRADPAVGALAGEVVARLFGDVTPSPSVPEQYSFYRRLRERRSDRVRLRLWLARLLFTPIPEDREAVRLPPPLRWLYPLVRPARLVGRWWRGPA